MNQPTAIIVTEYVGRPVNPFEKLQPVYEHGQYVANEYNDKWAKFEADVLYSPCPSIANTEPCKTVMAELKWQHPNETLLNDTEVNLCAFKCEQIWVPIVEYKPTNYLYEKYKDMPLTNADRERKIVEQKEGEGNELYKVFNELWSNSEKGIYNSKMWRQAQDLILKVAKPTRLPSPPITDKP